MGFNIVCQIGNYIKYCIYYHVIVVRLKVLLPATSRSAKKEKGMSIVYYTLVMPGKDRIVYYSIKTYVEQSEC